MSLVELLRASDALADLNDEELQAFAALGQPMHVAPGTVVQAGRAAWSGLFVLVEGALRKSGRDDGAKHVPRGTLLEWSLALAGEPANAHYVAPFGGAHVVTWPRARVNAFFSQRPHLLGLVRQRVQALPSPRPTPAAPGAHAVVPLHTEVAVRPGTGAWRKAALRWRLQPGDKKAATVAALTALTIAQWMPMLYVRLVTVTEIANRHQTRMWAVGLVCACALATLMTRVPARFGTPGDAAANRLLRLWLLNIGAALCSAWLAVTAWPLALVLCLGQLASAVCAVRLDGLRNHRHPTYIVLQSRRANWQTHRWRNAARLANVITTCALVLCGARVLQTGSAEPGDLAAATFLCLLTQHAWRESFSHTLVAHNAASVSASARAVSFIASPEVRIAPGQRLGVVGVSGSGLSWTAASAAHCLALPDAVVPVHAPLRDGTLQDFLGTQETDDLVAQALRWSGADRVVERFAHGLKTRVTRFDTRMSLQERVCLHVARLMLEGPAGLVLDACLDLVDADVAQVLITNLSCALPHTRVGIVSHQADILRRCQRVVVLAPNQAMQEGEFYGMWTRGLLASLTYHSHA